VRRDDHAPARLAPEYRGDAVDLQLVQVHGAPLSRGQVSRIP
jgi:hypothetical protein